MSIYRDILKGRPVTDLRERGSQKVREALDRFESAIPKKPGIEATAEALVKEFGSKVAVQQAWKLIKSVNSRGTVWLDTLDERHRESLRAELMRATPVDITGVLPESTEGLGSIEPRAFPWRYTWLEHFDFHVGMLITTEHEPCPCCDILRWKVTAEIFLGDSLPLFAGREAVQFDEQDQAPEITSGSIMDADILQTVFGMQSYVARLLSCKNVRSETVRPNAGHSKKSAKRKSKGIEWRVVTITRGKRTYRLGRSSPNSRAEGRYHAVGGHFKTYTQDAPLLGHAVGTFFWGEFARGNPKRGEIHKVFSDRRNTPLLPDAIETHATRAKIEA